MFKVIINDVGYVKEFNEEFSREKLVEITKEIGEKNKNIGGITGEIIVNNGKKTTSIEVLYKLFTKAYSSY